MIIHGESVVAKKRGDLERKLRRLGYDKFVRKDGRTLVRHRTAFKPTVVIDDDGWMMVKRSPIRIDPPGKRDNKLRYLWCLPRSPSRRSVSRWVDRPYQDAGSRRTRSVLCRGRKATRENGEQQ